MIERYVLTKDGKITVRAIDGCRNIEGELWFAHEEIGGDGWKISHFNTGFSAILHAQEVSELAWVIAEEKIKIANRSGQMRIKIEQAILECRKKNLYPLNK